MSGSHESRRTGWKISTWYPHPYYPLYRDESHLPAETQHTLILDYVLIELQPSHSCPKLFHGSDSYKCSLRDHNSSTSGAEWGLKLRLEQDGLVPPSSFVSFIWCSKTYGSLLYACSRSVTTVVSFHFIILFHFLDLELEVSVILQIILYSIYYICWS